MNRLFAIRSAVQVIRRFNSKFSHDYEKMVNANKCVVFMKGTPEEPRVSDWLTNYLENIYPKRLDYWSLIYLVEYIYLTKRHFDYE